MDGIDNQVVQIVLLDSEDPRFGLSLGPQKLVLVSDVPLGFKGVFGALGHSRQLLFYDFASKLRR